MDPWACAPCSMDNSVGGRPSQKLHCSLRPEVERQRPWPALHQYISISPAASAVNQRREVQQLGLDRMDMTGSTRPRWVWDSQRDMMVQHSAVGAGRHMGTLERVQVVVHRNTPAEWIVLDMHGVWGMHGGRLVGELARTLTFKHVRVL